MTLSTGSVISIDYSEMVANPHGWMNERVTNRTIFQFNDKLHETDRVLIPGASKMDALELFYYFLSIPFWKTVCKNSQIMSSSSLYQKWMKLLVEMAQ